MGEAGVQSWMGCQFIFEHFVGSGSMVIVICSTRESFSVQMHLLSSDSRLSWG